MNTFFNYSFDQLVKLEAYFRTRVLVLPFVLVYYFLLCELPIVFLPFVQFSTFLTIALAWSGLTLLFPISMALVYYLDHKRQSVDKR